MAETGSFTAAAHLLRVSQSGVSAQVRKLERELGVVVFDRTTRRIAITAEGERLLPTIRAAVATVERIAATANDLRGRIIGPLRIGTVTGLTWPPLFDAITFIHTAHPEVDITLEESTSDDLIVRLHNGDLDAAVAAWSLGPPEGLASTTIVDDALVAVVADDHPWSARRSVSPADLVGVPLIALPRGTGARLAMDAMFVRAGLTVEPRWEVASPASVTLLASRGLGVAVASETTVADVAGLVALRIEDPRARSALGVVWRHDPGPATRALLGALRLS